MNASMALLVEPPFQWWVFLTVTALNILLESTGFILKSINWCVDGLVKEMIVLRKGNSSQETLEATLQKAIAAVRDELDARKPIGKIIGLLEREIYLYALISPLPSLITAVLLFKAFSGWLKLGDMQSEKENGEAEICETKGIKTLARYYAYAIGNFISLAWAILIFEAMRLAFILEPQLQAILLISSKH